MGSGNQSRAEKRLLTDIFNPQQGYDTGQVTFKSYIILKSRTI